MATNKKTQTSTHTSLNKQVKIKSLKLCEFFNEILLSFSFFAAFS